MRAAAARAIHVGFVRALQGSIEKALEKEEDPDPAREEIRALASLGGVRTEEAVLRARRRFGGRLDDAVAHALARTLGPDALGRIVEGKADVRGTVILEADISSEGCVKNIRTIETVHPGLDLEAVRAASQNRYRPARIGGVAIPWRFRFFVRYRRVGT